MNRRSSVAVVFAIVLAASAVAAVPVAKSSCREQFEVWKGKHGKRYASAAEHKKKLAAFCTSLKEIHEINARPGATWRAALNPYSDLTWEEFSASKLMAAQNCSATHKTPVDKLVTIDRAVFVKIHGDARV
jgi:hypothetical protein